MILLNIKCLNLIRIILNIKKSIIIYHTYLLLYTNIEFQKLINKIHVKWIFVKNLIYKFIKLINILYFFKKEQW